jgi:hypothetical protein
MVNTAVQRVKDVVAAPPRSEILARSVAQQKEEVATLARKLEAKDAPETRVLFDEAQAALLRLEAQMRQATERERSEAREAEERRVAPILEELTKCATIASDRWANEQFGAHIAPKVEQAFTLLHEVHRNFEALVAEQAKAYERGKDLAKQLGRGVPPMSIMGLGNLYELARRIVRARLISDRTIPDHLSNLLTASRG